MKTVPDITDPQWIAQREKWWNEFYLPYMSDEFKVEEILKYKPIFFGENYDVNDPIWEENMDEDFHIHWSEFILLEPVQNEDKWRSYIQNVIDMQSHEKQKVAHAEAFLKSRHKYEKMFYKTKGWHSPKTEINYFYFIQGKEYNPGKVTFFGYEFEENPYKADDLFKAWSLGANNFLRNGGKESEPTESKYSLTSEYVVKASKYSNEFFKLKSSNSGYSWMFFIELLRMISLDEKYLTKTLNMRSTSIEKFMASNRPAFAKQLVGLIEASDCDGLKLAWDHVKNKSDDPDYTID